MDRMLAFMVVPEWVPFGAAGVVVIAIVIAISAARARKRTEALTRVAQEVGFSFEGNKWSDPGQSRDLKTTLFRKGNSRSFRNIMTGSSAGLPVTLFDYSFVVSSERSSHTTSQTVAAFSKRELLLPEFELEPAGIMKKIGDALLHKGIRFDSHPDFSHRYLLRGAEEERIRELFTPGLLSYLEGLDAQKKWRLEGTGQTLILYRGGKTVDPDELRPFLEDAGPLAVSFFSLASLRKPAL